MKTYFFRADLVLDTPLHLGSGKGHEFIDGLILRDGQGQPLISGTSLCGLLASHARDRLRLEGLTPGDADQEPVFQALFGSARDETGGRESRLVLLDASFIPDSGASTFVQDRNSINRDRGSAEIGHLFHDEVVAAKTRFHFMCEFREKETVAEEEKRLTAAGRDTNQEALHLLLDIFEVLEHGYSALGGKTGTGHGTFHLEHLQEFWMDHQDPDDVLTFALEGPEAFETRHPLDRAHLKGTPAPSRIHIVAQVSHDPPPPGPEHIIFRGRLRPLEPLLVKTGYTTEIVNPVGSHREMDLSAPLLPGKERLQQPIAIDAAFTRDDQNLPYLPGSSLRGCLRSHSERMIRTLMYTRFSDDHVARAAAWDLQEMEGQGRTLGRQARAADFDFIYPHSCLVSRLFGSPVLGGRLRLFDAVPVDGERFEQRLKLLDHVAIDRWTGGAAGQKKFNSRPFVPFYSDIPWTFERSLPDDSGDLTFELRLQDTEEWQLGLVVLLLKDLHLGRIQVGYGKNKGFGRVMLLPGYTQVEALTHPKGLLSGLVPQPRQYVGGFLHVPRRVLRAGTSFWLAPDEEPMYSLVKNAVQRFRHEILEWIPPKAENPAGEHP